MAGLVHVERQDDGVAVVRLENPPANALSVALLEELGEVAADLTAHPAGAVVITGGEKIFAAGADITEFSGPEEARRIGGHFRGTLDAIAAIPRTVIAAVNGFALGGGCELALACDLRVAAENATFGQPEILLGIIPGGGGTQRLARLVGPAKAKDMILTGRQVKAEEALQMGLADRTAPARGAIPVAIELAAQLAAGPTVAHALSKRAIDLGLDGTLADGLALEQELFADVFATEDARIGVRAFLEKTPPEFTGR
jgi:enoyl-CoA hydratase/carnithine racemase